MKLYDEAVIACKSVLRINPDDASVHKELGSIYEKLIRYDEAVAAFKEAIRINPDDVEAHILLGVSYLSLGNKAAAFEEYRILNAIDKHWANLLCNLIYN
jgi:Flp pilus assembly protein TadD